MIPTLGLFRGLFEFAEYAFLGAYTGNSGLTWSHFGDSKNGMEAVLLIFFFEWVIFVAVGILMHDESYYKALLSPRFRKKKGGFVEMQEIKAKATDRIAPVDIEAEVQSDDVAEERRKVASLINKQHKGPILASGLRKVFNVGNSVKVACDGVDLGVEDGECIGLLGPNGAGKTTLINMLVGYLDATEGEAFISNLNIKHDKAGILSMANSG